ncbi:MAG: DHH family phosphoesterase, partial [Lachnospiraceae bacterium]
MREKIRLKGQLKTYMYWPLILTVLLVGMNVVMYCINRKAGICISVFTVLYFAIVLSSFLFNKQVMLNEVINFATQYGTVQKKLLDEFEIPYILLDYNSKILWMNEAFSAISGKEKKYHKSITSIFPAITREVLEKDGENNSVKMEWNGHYYRVSMGKIYFETVTQGSAMIELKNNQQFLTVLYLFDETQIHHYIQTNQEQQLVSALIYIDNYEEALESIEEVKRSLLVALVDRKVSKYFAERDSIVKKIEKDKYFVVFKHKYLQGLLADKFDILEEVKTIKVGNEMAVTLSIGVGVNGSSYN